VSSSPADPVPHRYLPLGVRVEGRHCCVIGGGEIGTRKVQNLLRAGAQVTIIAPAATARIEELAASGRITWRQEIFRPEQCAGAFLIVAASDDPEVNAAVVRAAGESGALSCDASSSESTQIIFGALHEQDGMTVAVFSDGRDPGRARRLRDRIRNLLSGRHS